MPSVTYMNQSAPFWDFVASLEQQGQNHPFFSQNQNQTENTERGEEGHPFGPWGWGFPRAFPHRGPPPPPGPPPSHHDHAMEDYENEKDQEKEKEKEKDQNNDNGEGPSNNSGSDSEGWGRGRGRHGRCGGGRRNHGFGPRGPCGPEGFGPHHGPPHHGPPHHGHGPHHHHGPHGRHGRGRGGWGWGPWGGRGGLFNPMNFAAGLFDPSANKETNENQDFTPDADIFDTPSSWVVHVSLPGAKKEDVGVNWDAEKSELSIAGVIYRPGDEEFLKTLAMDERKIGPFERKIRLGTRANPAQIDAEGITAKLEDGILRVDVPKLEQDFVEVRKVDIE